MKTIFYLFLIILCSAIIFFILTLISPNFLASLNKKEIIPVSIKLENECSFTDDAFIVLEPESGRTAKFYGGKAIIYLPENSRVKLSMSSDFPDFAYDGDLTKIKREMTLVANCDVSPRLKNIFDSFNKRFSQ